MPLLLGEVYDAPAPIELSLLRYLVERVAAAFGERETGSADRVVATVDSADSAGPPGPEQGSHHASPAPSWPSAPGACTPTSPKPGAEFFSGLITSNPRT